MQTFIIPSPQWLKKYGNVYCSHCKDRTRIAMIPTIKKSVIFRREHATCKLCAEAVSHEIDHWLKINYEPDYSDAAFSIGHIYG